MPSIFGIESREAPKKGKDLKGTENTLPADDSAEKKRKAQGSRFMTKMKIQMQRFCFLHYKSPNAEGLDEEAQRRQKQMHDLH